jgi:tetratricopeptide (TPR) repeat protein
MLQTPAWADFKATPEEQKMCIDTIYSRKVPGDPNWTHVHHYCDCIRFTNRAYMVMGKNKQDSAYNLSEALGGCDYVLSHTTPELELIPEIFLQKGIIYSLQGKESLAAGEYLKSMNGNPKLIRAYIGLAKFYEKNKDTKSALEIITKGIRINPHSKALIQMYKALGGTQPLPDSALTSPITSVESPAIIEKTETMPSLDQPKSTEPKTRDTETQLPNQMQQKAGSAKNPWCRFCPEPQSQNPNASTPVTNPKAEQ